MTYGMLYTLASCVHRRCDRQVVCIHYVYVVPMLVHGHAAHVTACELNPHSVTALTRNMSLNHIVSSRYTILAGDNRTPSARTHITSCAVTRVSLGLLPSSEDGWELALVALSVTGGWMHVHANVREGEEERWSESELMTRLKQMSGGMEGVKRTFKVSWRWMASCAWMWMWVQMWMLMCECEYGCGMWDVGSGMCRPYRMCHRLAPPYVFMFMLFSFASITSNV